MAILRMLSALMLCVTGAGRLPGYGGSCSPAVQERAPFFITVEWLAERVKDPSLVLLHVGEKAEYEAGHIPGAQHIAVSDISTPADSWPIMELPSTTVLQNAFSRLGINDDSRIIVYFGKDLIAPTARVMLTLEYFGLGGRTSLLDGGLPAWRAAGKEVTTEIKTPGAGKPTPKVRQDVVVDAAWVQSKLNQPEVAVVDARTPNYYNGESAGKAARAGHIPGAVNIPYNSLADDSLKIKDRGTLEKIFSGAGVKPGQIVVAYCHIGQSASVVYWIARHLGYDARVYDGSFTEWSGKAELPVEKEP